MAFKYETLAYQIASDIRQHKLLAGSLLLSLRKFAHHHNISLSTATKTYNLLEQQGLIGVKPKSGYFVRDFLCVDETSNTNKKITDKPTAELVTHDTSDVMFEVLKNAMRPNMINLGAGFLPGSLLPIKELQRSLHRANRRLPAAAYSYGNEQGFLSLRQAISERLLQRNCHIKAEQLLITNGCLEAVNLAILELTKPGDVVAILTPCYSGLLMAIQHSGRQILEIPCTSQGPDLKYLEQLMQQNCFQAFIFSSVGYNPLGFNLSVKVKQKLADLIQHYQIPSIEDDAFGELGFIGEQTSPVYSYVSSSPNYIVYTGSFSKPLASGYRVGWLSSELKFDAMIKRKLNQNLTVSLPPQVGLADYLFSEGYQAHIKRLKVAIEQRLNHLAQLIRRYFDPSIQFTLPKGGLFLWLEGPEHFNAITFYHSALAQGISVAPGDIFSMNGTYKNCVRLTIAETDLGKTEQAILVLAKTYADCLKNTKNRTDKG
ncbi:PLP-dependent aminotransferase family protein [Catenovulum maritimum]|uniref:HTH gntR-type domain-containing protein n=1 Tax=Catenovulum maritimum TaxID=1513271 RepID=A0A0J8GVB6_9ALTE|nr:PLP-dependent aminotransferase family protein [Catenovulum maritimum]KMT66730.1 hypothetical protein XM47_00970 [Catenovulum maritimum]